MQKYNINIQLKEEYTSKFSITTRFEIKEITILKDFAFNTEALFWPKIIQVVYLE